MAMASGSATMPRRDSTSTRRTTLSRPERQRSQKRNKPMLRSPSVGPPAARLGATTNRVPSLSRTSAHVEVDEIPEPPQPSANAWVWFSRLITCCFVPPLLRFMGMTNPAVQQAWREKVALCFIILIMCMAVGFLTFGLKATLCPPSTEDAIKFFGSSDVTTFFNQSVLIKGYAYNFNRTAYALQNSAANITLDDSWRGKDISPLFSSINYCGQYLGNKDLTKDCKIHNDLAGITIPAAGSRCPETGILASIPRQKVYFDWTEVQALANPAGNYTLIVFNGIVMDVKNYFMGTGKDSNFLPKRSVALAQLKANLGRDGTRSFYYSQDTLDAAYCLLERYTVGFVDKQTPGCFASDVVLNVALVVILALVFTRFVVAIIFYYFVSARLVGTRTCCGQKRGQGVRRRRGDPTSGSGRGGAGGDSRDSPYTILLVTCYSEGESSIRGTLDSLAATEYPDHKKLLFVVSDGLITGSGNSKSTPEIILEMVDEDPTLPKPESAAYLAIADGARQHNRAFVHAGYYSFENHRVPTIVVVKCGTQAEASTKKPGNRGKRDSQLVLMNFLSRCVFDDIMTQLDFELFYRISHVVGVAPDSFEFILMVDADTQVARSSLTHMVNAMVNDISIMGLCGETRIKNKMASWVSAIQVFEYYISHHLGKAFESAFGGVTCLPGCFCMYRVKAPKGPNGSFVPILVNPDVVEEYSENVVDTLHKKNLLLLGEDRFLTTLMLRSFPKRKMMFVPQAICHTVVPEEFRVLLSQRRRWINSTVHNLLELILVRDLCGIFCFSMQFVVLLELIGTVVLPAAILFTLYLIVKIIMTRVVETLPLVMLLAILGLPGVLIVITTKKIVYIAWMLIYLLALPIWNFLLPIYAFWHFDDFTWGETRKVEGELKGDDHGVKEGRFDASAVVLKRWEDWERERRFLNAMAEHARRMNMYRTPTNPPAPGQQQTHPHPHRPDLAHM
ncbi:hypothetical protein HDU76_003367, partial [Blyttiomyces sp. JEL0837]